MPAYGRGGAGNIQAVEQENVRMTADIEANHGTAESYSKESLPAEYTRREEQLYAHMGRGGMGNYYSPKEWSKNGDRMDSSTPKDQEFIEGSNHATTTYGRGGAGNYALISAVKEENAARERVAEARTREKLRRDAENGVQQRLAVPAKAKLPRY